MERRAKGKSGRRKGRDEIFMNPRTKKSVLKEAIDMPKRRGGKEAKTVGGCRWQIVLRQVNLTRIFARNRLWQNSTAVSHNLESRAKFESGTGNAPIGRGKKKASQMAGK